jgi:hypothetical protein
MKGAIAMKEDFIIEKVADMEEAPLCDDEKIMDPFEQMCAVLREVNQAFEALFEQCKISYIEFDRQWYRSDAKTAKILAALWLDINNDISGQYQTGDLSRFSLQRWQQSLLDWKDITLAAVDQFAQSEMQLNLQAAQPVLYYPEAA